MPTCPQCASEVPLAQRFCGSCGSPVPASSQTGTVAMTGGVAVRTSRTTTPEPERFAPGEILAQRYRIAGRLGRGGMGEVYRAYDMILEQDVALKFLPAALHSSPEALDRFRNEVRLARQVSHPNVCRVYDIGEIEGAPFLSMEYVDGEDLASLLRRIGRLPSDKALDIARRLCAGLAAAHEKGVLHRDLKPANIMVDGRGEVLITDFGLAALAGSVNEAAVRQGTPAYQAPEQLAGREVTVKSDLYALGLVFYEMFTGKRAFEARSLEELVRMQRESTPAGITTIAKEVDPAVERAILRCLAPDPRNRPGSAKAVAAALPGGDPLAAALAAGETPSPEMVAQAGEREGLRPVFAVTCLAVTLVGLLVAAAVWDLTGIVAMTPFENSPEILRGMALDLVKRLGYTERPADSAWGLDESSDYLRYAQKHYPFERIRALLAAARPAPLVFWYRQSPQAFFLAPNQPVGLGYPGFATPGEIRLRLDMEGRLLAFDALPLQIIPPQGSMPDWKPLFDAAKLDATRLQPATPEWTPSAAFDTSAAWTGVLPDAPEVPVRIEAAAWRGRPVSFQIVFPWTQPSREQPASAGTIFELSAIYLMFVGGVVLAQRNLRLKRGDQAGAVRLALAFFTIWLGAAILTNHYEANADAAYRLFLGVAQNFGFAAVIGMAYLAIEPFVRRRSPRILISWARLLQSGLRDPLVAGDILAGLAAGALIAADYAIRTAASVFLAHHVEDLFDLQGTPLNVPQSLGGLFDYTGGAIFSAMLTVFFFFLVRLLLRRDWWAAAGVTVLFTLVNYASMTAPLFELPAVLVMYAIMFFILLRFGLLGLCAALLLTEWTHLWPFTLDPSRWYFGYSLTTMLLVAGLAGWAFRTATAGRPLLPDDSLA